MGGVPSAVTELEVSPQLPDMYAEPLEKVRVMYGDQIIEALGEDKIIIATRVP